MNQFRLVITGGDTVGHINSGIAVIESLQRRIKRLRVLWIGLKGSWEEDIVPRHQIIFRTLQIKSMERSFHPASILRDLKSIVAWSSGKHVINARRMLKEFEPDFVLGIGGSICIPVIIAATLMKKRCWILEQNSAPDFTVKLLSRIVDGVGIAYESTRRLLPLSAPVELTGNPILKRWLETSREEGAAEFGLDPSCKTLLVIGGSSGSTSLNNAVMELLKISLDGRAYEGWQIIHSVGREKYEKFMTRVNNIPRYFPHEFIYRVDRAFSAADLVVCRGGAMTLTEVTARGLPAIVVPWPGANKNHQYMNARTLADAGAVILINEEKFSGIKIATLLRDFRDNPARLTKVAEQSRREGKPDAAERVADFILAGEMQGG